jgi:polysaccharide export outer membrane protein
MTRFFVALLTGLLALPMLAGGARAQEEGYLLRPGDTLRIEVLEDATLNRSVLVAPDGRISMPLAGVVRAGGRPIEAVQADLVARLSENFATAPNVFVSVEGLNQAATSTGTGGAAASATMSIFVMGEANKPGKISVVPGTTVLQFFAEMGGFSKFAATKRIQLRRTDRKTGEETIYNLNYKAIEGGSSGAGSTTLADGDVIVVPQRKLFE